MPRNPSDKLTSVYPPRQVPSNAQIYLLGSLARWLHSPAQRPCLWQTRGTRKVQAVFFSPGGATHISVQLNEDLRGHTLSSPSF